jgi:hypothetical protein
MKRTKLARKPKLGEAFLELGRVEQALDGGWLVRTDAAMIVTKRAVACLLEPVAGDLVLLSYGPKAEAYVLSVLERPAGTAGMLSYEGDLTMAVQKGRLNLTSTEGLAISSEKDLAVAAERITVAAQAGEARIGFFSTVSRFIETQAEQISVAAEAWDAVIHRMTQRLGFNQRFVSEAEEVQAASMRQLVEGTMTIHAKNANVIAEEHVKVDAGQIHLG